MICFLAGICASAWGQCQSKGIHNETTFIQQRFELKATDLETSGTGKSEDFGSVIQCEASECEQDSSTAFQERSGLTEKKKTPMCLVNELARHHKVFVFID